MPVCVLPPQLQAGKRLAPAALQPAGRKEKDVGGPLAVGLCLPGERISSAPDSSPSPPSRAGSSKAGGSSAGLLVSPPAALAELGQNHPNWPTGQREATAKRTRALCGAGGQQPAGDRQRHRHGDTAMLGSHVQRGIGQGSAGNHGGILAALLLFNRYLLETRFRPEIIHLMSYGDLMMEPEIDSRIGNVLWFAALGGVQTQAGSFSFSFIPHFHRGVRNVPLSLSARLPALHTVRVSCPALRPVRSDTLASEIQKSCFILKLI